MKIEIKLEMVIVRDENKKHMGREGKNSKDQEMRSVDHCIIFRNRKLEF